MLQLASPRTPKSDAEADLAREMKSLDPNGMTPIDALTWLARQRALLLEVENGGESGGGA